MLRTLMCAAASLTVLSGCGTMGDPIDRTMAAAPKPESPTIYASMAAASDMYEMQAAEIAVQRAQRPEVRSFAQMMIEGHAKTTAELKRQAQNAGVALPVVLPPDKMQMLATLRSVPAASFDATYMRQQVNAHQEALALHQAFSLHGEDASLRYAASLAVPVVTDHLRQAQALAGPGA